jgi:UDP-GlcNAc:undecaprenyl-phosphate GlcNAc-1-phosphate transferase
MHWGLIVTGVLVSLLVGVALLPLLIRLAHKHGLLDYPAGHKRHKLPVPVLGGIGLFLAVWSAVLVANLIFPEMFTEVRGSLIYIFLGALMIFLTGMSDDLRPLSAWVKLLAQVAAGLVLYMGGLAIDPISVPFHGSVSIGGVSVIITLVWVVGLTNSINLIDGLDGLASGVSLIGAITLALVGGLLGLSDVLIFAYALAGFLTVFLYYNRYPARIFLGDSGSLQIGYYFAVISLLVPIKSFTAVALYVPLLVLGMPLLETGVSFSRRLVAGKSVLSADRRHIFHYLALAGLKRRQIVWIFYALSLVFGLFALAMFYWNRLLVFGLLVLFMVVIFVTFFILMTNLTRSKRLGRQGRNE